MVRREQDCVGRIGSRLGVQGCRYRKNRVYGQLMEKKSLTTFQSVSYHPLHADCLTKHQAPPSSPINTSISSQFSFFLSSLPSSSAIPNNFSLAPLLSTGL
ncbi:hypothetical protein E4T42_01032 [Aureobasidium subglaciale]|nr:hypothetical protein E4T42_01032 [Aureobasidium subglaciale]